MNDYVVRATAASGQVRAFAAYTGNMVEYARAAHNTSPVITAGLGRLLTAGSMMGSMMKGENDILTLKAEGSGPAGYYLVTSDSHGNVRGYAANPDVILPANSAGKLDVAGSLGVGLLTVTRDLGLKEPYTGTCELVTGEIAEDLTYYFATSEQTPSAVGLGVLMTAENTVNVAGGFIIQMMPDATEETISSVEKKIETVTSVTAMLEKGMTPENIIEYILEDLEPEILERTPVRFFCGCSREKVSGALALLGREELRSLIEEGSDIEIKCHYCSTTYMFTPEELKKID